MSKRRFKHIVKGVSPDGDEHEWTGAGWGDLKRGKRMSRHDCEMTAFDCNCSGEGWIAYRDQVND